MNEEERKAVEMLNIFRLEHKFFNIRQADNLEANIEIVLNLIEKLQKENELAKQALIKKCNIADERNQLLKDNQKLREYIAIAPNLDEMTAIKYRNIQQDAYIQGRAEEQQKAKQIIHENYIPKQTVKDKIEEYKKLSDKFYVKFLESDRYNTDIREKGIKCDAIILALEELIEEEE